MKTNQIVGGGVAKRFANVRQIPLIVRAGHLPSDTAKWRFGEKSSRAKKVSSRERRLVRSADHVLVTTEFMRETLEKNYCIEQTKISVLPNYVDTREFRPTRKDVSLRIKAGYVGRLEQKKNVVALVESFSGLDVDLELIGDGSLKSELIDIASTLDVKLFIHERVPNRMLPEIYNGFSFYIQPSHLEHHPKTLMEAMACGLPVVASNRKGNRELIDDMRTGILCETDTESIRRAIDWLLKNPDYAREMGTNAREFITRHFDLERVLTEEKRILDQEYARKACGQRGI